MTEARGVETRNMSKQSTEENRQLLKIQADMADRIAQSDKRIQGLEDQIKNLAQSQEKNMTLIATRMEQMFSQHNQANPNTPVSPRGSGILKTPPINNELSNSINKNGKNHETDSRTGVSHNWNLPKSDFPWFDGTDPIDWAIRCKLHFDVYMVPEMVKSRMAILHFSGEALEWYKSNMVNLDPQHGKN